MLTYSLNPSFFFLHPYDESIVHISSSTVSIVALLSSLCQVQKHFRSGPAEVSFGHPHQEPLSSVVPPRSDHQSSAPRASTAFTASLHSASAGSHPQKLYLQQHNQPLPHPNQALRPQHKVNPPPPPAVAAYPGRDGRPPHRSSASAQQLQQISAASTDRKGATKVNASKKVRPHCHHSLKYSKITY